MTAIHRQIQNSVNRNCYLIQTDFVHFSQRFDYLQYVEIMATHLRAKSMAKGCVWSTSIGSDMPGLSRTI